jgi:hypothetical protein
MGCYSTQLLVIYTLYIACKATVEQRRMAAMLCQLLMFGVLWAILGSMPE